MKKVICTIQTDPITFQYEYVFDPDKPAIQIANEFCKDVDTELQRRISTYRIKDIRIEEV